MLALVFEPVQEAVVVHAAVLLGARVHELVARAHTAAAKLSQGVRQDERLPGLFQSSVASRAAEPQQARVCAPQMTAALTYAQQREPELRQVAAVALTVSRVLARANP